jgi:hypothetical protein
VPLTGGDAVSLLSEACRGTVALSFVHRFICCFTSHIVAGHPSVAR